MTSYSSSSSSHDNNNNIDVTSTDSIYFFAQQNKVSDILNLNKLSYIHHITNNNNNYNNDTNYNNNENNDHINTYQSIVVDNNSNNIDERRSSRRLALRSINESSSHIQKYRDDDHDHNEDDLDSDSDDDDDDVLVEEKVVVEDADDHEDDVVTTLSRNALKNSRPPPPHPKKRGWHSTRIGAIDIVAALSTNTNDTNEVLTIKNTRGSKSSNSSSSSSSATAGAVTAADFDTNGDHDVFQVVKRLRGRPRKIITPIDDDLFREIVMKYTHIDSSTDWAKVMMELPVGHDLNIGKCRNRWRKMNISPADSSAVDVEAIKSGHDRYDPMIEKAFMKQSRKKDPDELRCRTKWTLEMDAHLSEAVVLHGPKWKKAAELVGNNVNNLDCHRRWQHYLKPMKEGYKNHDWTVDEYYELKDLVLTHTSMGRKTPDKVTIDWSFISKKMNRKYNACRHTWHHICNQSLKQGRFTKEEDEIICRKAKDALNSTSTGTLPHGFWVAIGEELNRIPDSITLRWNRYLSTL